MSHKNPFAVPLLEFELITFPDVYDAIEFRDGLVAVGGDLSVPRLISAYSQGVFPWFSEEDPICWWATAPRTILLPESLHLGRSLHKILRNKRYIVKMNHSFEQVMQNCADANRPDQNGTWINSLMLSAYVEFFRQGYTHSFECWIDDQLAGGFYGAWLGNVFFGESMFAHQNNASKIAFAHGVRYLQSQGVQLIDCQMHTHHLARFGAVEMPFDQFSQKLKFLCAEILPRHISSQVLHSN